MQWFPDLPGLHSGTSAQITMKYKGREEEGKGREGKGREGGRGGLCFLWIGTYQSSLLLFEDSPYCHPF